MLVLSRKVGERILIGDQVAVTIVRVSSGGVRIGIEAPADMAVLRAEIVEEQAASGTGEVLQTPQALAESARKPTDGKPRSQNPTATNRSDSHPGIDEKPLRKAR